MSLEILYRGSCRRGRSPPAYETHGEAADSDTKNDRKRLKSKWVNASRVYMRNS